MTAVLNELQNIICDSCGNIIQRRGVGNIIRCPSCGARHKWVDAEEISIFGRNGIAQDKLRRLMLKAKTIARSREAGLMPAKRGQDVQDDPRTEEEKKADADLVAAYESLLLEFDDEDEEDYDDLDEDGSFWDNGDDGLAAAEAQAAAYGAQAKADAGSGWEAEAARGVADPEDGFAPCDHVISGPDFDDGQTRRRGTVHTGILAYIEGKSRR